MREIFEIEKELKFNSNIAEITSISLEEKHNITNGVLNGTFIVSGDYKIHEISLNKEKFNFKIPFEYHINSDMDEKTLDLEITNFIYDTDNESLYVTINYELTADRKDILLFDDEENLEEFLKSREVEIIMDDTMKEIDSVLEKEEIKKDNSDDVICELEEIIEENKSLGIKDEATEDIEQNVLIKEILESKEDSSRNMDESKEELLNSVNVDDDSYITYQIHIVKSEDTLESILFKYNMSLDELKEYNTFDILQLGDKLIIPITNEE